MEQKSYDMDNYNHNPLFNPRFTNTKPTTNQQPKQLQPNTNNNLQSFNDLQLQFQHFPVNHNLKSFNNNIMKSQSAPTPQNNQHIQQQHPKTCTSNLPKGIKKVQFIPKTKSSNPATIEHTKSQPKLLRNYSKRAKLQHIPPNNQAIPYNNNQYNQQHNQPQLYNQSNSSQSNINQPNIPQLTYNTSEYGHQYTPFGISQQRPYSEPILKHTQTETNIFQSQQQQQQYQQSNIIHQRSQTVPAQYSNGNNNTQYMHPHSSTHKHHKFNKYMPKPIDEINHAKVAHMYTMKAHFENNVLSIEVYDSIQGNTFRNEFVQRDFAMFHIFDIAKILVDAINGTKTNSISINGFKPISISEYHKWCYLTVNGTQIPSFALRPTY